MPHSPRSRLGLAYLLVTAVGWGLNWPLIKVILRELPPLFARGSSGLAAAVLLALIAVGRGESLKVPPGDWRRLGIASALNVFGWMGFATLSMMSLTVAESALIVYTVPIWATLLAWPLLGTLPSMRGFVALAMAMAGIVVLFSDKGISLGAGKVGGISWALAAAISFALGAVTAKRPIRLPPIALTAWQVGLACVPMTLLGLLIEQPDLTGASLSTWLAVGYMALVPMGLCYLSWFATLRALPPGAAATGTLLVPIIGIISAALLIGEPLGAREIIALILTLAGVALAVIRS
ncbi:DMT family transporter [Rhodoligotrophos defluvii]|uniref:DMT family transporter n=1 Tax=Rhodoligotrophos defluvii TaxID=2561934 RepID=UPI0010C9A94B|nr:DMT family transporter [Rhodoligotrophos defluvii]